RAPPAALPVPWGTRLLMVGATFSSRVRSTTGAASWVADSRVPAPANPEPRATKPAVLAAIRAVLAVKNRYCDMGLPSLVERWCVVCSGRPRGAARPGQQPV